MAEVVLQRREAGEGVLTRVSLLFAEADSFVRPQYLRAGKLLNLGGRAVCGEGGKEGRWDQSRQLPAVLVAGRVLCVAVKRRLQKAWPQTWPLGEKGTCWASGKIKLTLRNNIQSKLLEKTHGRGTGFRAGEGQPAGKEPSLQGAGGEDSIQARAWRPPPSTGAGRDLPELCPRRNRGDALGDCGVLALTGLFSGFRGALG